MSQNSKLFLLITMGLLSAFGPFVTDFYLPALPTITKFFGTSVSMVQLSLTSSMFGLAVGQLILGPLSDKFGRKPIIIASLLTYLLATILCIFSPEIKVFIFARLIQGFAASGGVVISKSVAADLFKNRELTKFFSLLMIVNGIAPIASPVLGGFLIGITTWQGIFWALFLIGVILLILNLNLIESNPAHLRFKGKFWSAFKNFGPILKNKQFMNYVFAQTFAMGFLFSYIASSPFIFQEHYHLTPVQFSICFGLNALGIMVGSSLVSFFKSEKTALKTGGICLIALSLVLGSVLYSEGNIFLLECIFILLTISLGLILPTTSALGLNLVHENNGSASAILGFLPFLMGSVVSPLVGIGNIVYSTLLSIIICCLISVFFIFRSIRNDSSTYKRII